jgi:hypothetical protein
MGCFTMTENSAGSESYTVDVLHSNGYGSGGEAWLHVNDEAVSAVQREEMFGDQGKASEG